MLHVFRSGTAGIKGVDFAGKVPLPALRHADQFNPWVVSRISGHNLVRAIGLTIADNRPFEESDVLCQPGDYASVR